MRTPCCVCVCVRVCVCNRRGVCLIIRNMVLCHWGVCARCNFPFLATSKERNAEKRKCEVGAMLVLRATL